jgi:hypothetical protein
VQAIGSIETQIQQCHKQLVEQHGEEAANEIVNQFH